MRVLSDLLPLLYLAALAVGSVLLADGSWKSVTSYRSEYVLDRTFEAGPALASRVVVVVFDGLSVDSAADLPVFGDLSDRGAPGTLRTTVPSLSNPARAAILTGAWAEVSGVTNNSSFEPVPVQSLFSLARQQGMESMAYGTRFWPRAFGEDLGDGYRRPSRRPVSYEIGEVTAWQDEACQEVSAHLQDSSANLAVVALLAGDDAGHSYGGESAEYREAVAAVDRCVGQLADVLGQGATFVVVSDHGHIHHWGKGGHGGDEPEVMNAPFVMAGPGVKRSGPIDARIVDIAPTVSVLLGLPIPANSQGAVLWDALEVPPEHQGRLRDLERVQREAIDAHLPDREESLAAERRSRLLLAIGSCVWLVLVALAALRRQRLVPLGTSVAVFVASFLVLAYFFQLGTSISAVVREEYLYSFFVRLIGAAALGFGAAAFCLTRFDHASGGATASQTPQVGARRPWLASPQADATVRLGLLITSGFALFVTATYYQHGLLMHNWMIEIGPVFAAYLGLLAILGVALGTIVAVALTALRRGKAAKST